MLMTASLGYEIKGQRGDLTLNEQLKERIIGYASPRPHAVQST